MANLHCTISGKAGGDFSMPENGRLANWCSHVSAEVKRQSKGKVERVVIPRCGFTTEIARWTEEEDAFDPLSLSVFRTLGTADGILIDKPSVAVGILTADWPVVVLYDEGSGIDSEPQMAVLHCGLSCLLPEKGSGIIQKAFQMLFNSRTTSVFVGYGIRNCCYGLDEVPPKLRKFSSEEKIKTGPLRGKFPIHLPDLILEQLKQLEVPEGQITIHPECTAHTLDVKFGQLGTPRYHSEAYEGEKAGHNLVLAWIEP